MKSPVLVKPEYLVTLYDPSPHFLLYSYNDYCSH